MENGSLLGFINDLHSSKSKDRSNALDELVSTLKQSPEVIPTKVLASVCETLVELVVEERQKYCDLLAVATESSKGRISLSENRLSSAAYVLRLFIEKTCSRFRVKTLRMLPAVLPDLMIHETSKSLLEPASVHLTFALHALISSKLFQLKMALHQWISLVNVVCKYLSDRLDVSLLDRNISNLISILDALLSIDCVGLSQVSQVVHRTMMKYLQRNKKQDANTRLVISIINQLVLKTHCFNIMDTLRLIKETWRHITVIGATTNESTQNELSYLDVYASDLIYNSLPTMVGSEEAMFEPYELSLLSVCREYLITRLAGYRPSSLSITSFRFSDNAHKKVSFFEFEDFQLKDCADIFPWLRIMSITKLLISYFRLLHRDLPELHIFKRRKFEPTFPSILRNSQTLLAFACNGVSSGNNEIALVSMQITAFAAALHDMDEEAMSELVDVIISKFQNIELTKWICLALIPIITQRNYAISDEQMNRILKLSLPLIRQPDLCSTSCAVLTAAMKYSSFTITDKTAISQIWSLYELSDVNGPESPCNEAFVFWQSLQDYGPDLEFLSQHSITNEVIKWLKVRWSNLIDLREDQDHFYQFLAWLCGRKRFGPHSGGNDLRPRSLKWNGFQPERYCSWIDQLEQRSFILQEKPTTKSFREAKKDVISDNCVADKVAINDILYRMLELIEGENSLGSLSRFKWICQVIKLSSYLAGDSSYMDYLLNFKRAAAIALSAVKLDTDEEYRFLFERVLSLREAPATNLLFQEFPVEKIINRFKQLMFLASSNVKNERSAFQSSNDRRIQTTDAYFDGPSTGESLVALSVRAYLHVSRQKSSDAPHESWDFLLNYVDGFDTDNFIRCLPPITSWLESAYNDKLSDDNRLERFTELLSGHLLQGDFNTSSTATFHICAYLDSIRSLWLEIPDTALNTDCNDILDWIISRFNDASFSGTHAIRRFSHMLLNMLRYHDLSRGHVRGGKQKAFASFSKSLRTLGPVNVMSELANVGEYMISVSNKNQNILFSEVCDLFEIPQQSIEMSAMHALAMLKISSASYSSLILCLKELICYSGFDHTRVYILSAIKSMASHLALTDTPQLFSICSLSIISQWLDRSLDKNLNLADVCDIGLFGFEDFTTFFNLYNAELSATYFARAPNNTTILNELLKRTKKSKRQLFLDYYHLSLPLSFATGGIGEAFYNVSQNVLGKSNVKTQSALLIYRSLLRLIDLGSNIEIGAVIEKYFPQNVRTKDLFTLHSREPRFQNHLHIPLETGVCLLRKLFERFPLHEKDIFLLLLWILSDLNTSFNSWNQLNSIRELKLVLAISEGFFDSYNSLPKLLPPLCRFVAETRLHDEVSDIIIFLLHLSKDSQVDIADELLQLFYNLLLFKKLYHKGLGPSFIESLNHIIQYAHRYQKTLACCIDAIQGETLGMEVYTNDEILDSESCNEESILLLSLLFEYASKPVSLVLEHSPTTRSVQNLLQFQVSNELVTENFQLWLAYYLNSFKEANMAKSAFAEPRNQLTNSYDDLFNDFGSLKCLINDYLVIEKRTLLMETCSVIFFCQTLTALFLNDPKYKTENALVHNILALSENHEQHSPSITEHVFFSIHKVSEKFCDMQHFLMHEYLDDRLSYSEWLVRFDTALLDRLSLSLPNSTVFRPLISISRTFAQRALPNLFNVLLCYDHKAVVGWISNLFEPLEELLKCKHGDQKVNSCLSLINMLMVGRRLEERYSTLCLSHLPLDLVCKAAKESNNITFAYMTYEMLHMTDKSHLDLELLRCIYESLGDVDLISGLPAPHTLMGAVQLVSETEPRTRKNFMFNNAVLDARFHAIDQAQKFRLLKAAESQGFYGIASCLSEAQAYTDNSNYKYKWALQLSKWDLPTPQSIASKEQALYHVLKRVSFEASDPSFVLESSIIQLVKSKGGFERPFDWLETISEVVLLKDFSDTMKRPANLANFLRKSFAIDRRALYDHSFSDHKSNFQSRYLLSKILLDRIDATSSVSPTDLLVCSGALLTNYVKLAIQEKCPQDALRVAVLLESLVQHGPAIPKLKRLQHYVSAIALWECSDVKTPIMILKDLMSDHYEQKFAEESLDTLIEVSNDEVQALLVDWVSKSRIETASTIYENYVDTFETSIKDHDTRADIFYTLADFLESQVKKMREEGEIEERQRRCEKGSEELRSLETIYKNSGLSDSERKDARKHHARVMIQLSSDREILNNLLVQRVQFVWRSLHYFINTMVFTNRYDHDVLDKFCGLWFEHDGDDTINSYLRKEIGMIPSWKFLPWVNQISSKLSIEETEFQKPLQLTMKRLLYKLPYHSLYSVLSMKLYEKHSLTRNSIIPQKIEAVQKLLLELQGYDSGNYYRAYVQPLQEFCEASVELSHIKVQSSTTNSKRILLKGLKVGEYWLNRLPRQKLPLPTVKWRIKSSSEGKSPPLYIASVDQTVDISTTGLSMPKIVTFCLSDGTRHKALMKGSNDDLRQDAIMEQVFQQVNDVLQRDKQMRKLDLNISTYTVIPLGPRAGIIEYVTNSLSLNQILVTLHKKDAVSFNQARKEMKNVQSRSNEERLRVYKKLTQEIKPQLRNFFFDSFPDSNDWFSAKKTYTKGIAATSIVGYILGLGDRHLNNILLDHRTGKPTHIDLGIAFDQGRLLPIPEMVPFRLTRDIVDGFGITGVEGLFRKSCEHTYAVLRENYEKVMHVLNILKWDPLYSWIMSPVKKHKHLLEAESQNHSSVPLGSEEEAPKSEIKEIEQNQQSYRALKGVEDKLIRNGLSVEATVQELIQQASDPKHLSVIYMGWSPFY